MKKLLHVSFAFCLSLTLTLVLCPGSSGQTSGQGKVLGLGVITSMTGPMAPAFKPIFDALKPTEDLINQRGGVTVAGQQYSVKIVAEDDQSSPAGGIGAINKLVQQGIRFMMAPLFHVTHMAIMPIAEESKVVRIKFGSSTEEVNPRMRYSFYADSTLYNVEPCFDYLVKNYPKAKRIAIIMPDDPGVKFALDLNIKAIKKRGLQEVFTEKFRIGSEDFYPILTKALEQKPDAIDMPVSMVIWSAGIINQSRELGFNGPIFAPGLFGDINLVNSMLDKASAYDVFHGGPDVLSDKMLPIVKDLRKLVEQTNQPVRMESMMSLDAFYPLLQCIEKANSLDSDKVVAAIESMNSIDTIYGKGRWGGQEFYGVNHVIIRPITISRIVNGKVQQLDFIDK